MKKHVYISKPLDENGLIPWNATEDKTWHNLITRQNEVIKNRACDEFKAGLKALDFDQDKAVQLVDVNKKLKSYNGWQVGPVPAVIPPKEFFTMLASKTFPAATFIRTEEEIDYIQEPDIFHEVYGHVPLLTNPTYAEFLCEYGKLALTFSDKDRWRFFRLLWFSAEFGLIKSSDEHKIYGSGILSSFGETKYALTDDNTKLPFSVLDILRTPFRIDIMQPVYFVIDSYEQLFQMLELDIAKIIEESRELGDFPAQFPPKDKKPDKEKSKGIMPC